MFPLSCHRSVIEIPLKNKIKLKGLDLNCTCTKAIYVLLCVTFLESALQQPYIRTKHSTVHSGDCLYSFDYEMEPPSDKIMFQLKPDSHIGHLNCSICHCSLYAWDYILVQF